MALFVVVFSFAAILYGAYTITEEEEYEKRNSKV